MGKPFDMKYVMTVVFPANVLINVLTINVLTVNVLTN